MRKEGGKDTNFKSTSLSKSSFTSHSFLCVNISFEVLFHNKD